MLSALHTYRIMDGSAAFAPFALPDNPALAEVLARLPTSPEGWIEPK